MIVATAGTTNTGAIDDLEGLYQLCREKNLWFHIDGAYGAFAKIATHPVAGQLAGIQLADSISLDPHKWLFNPFGVGCALVRDEQLLRKTYELSAEYLVDTEQVEDFQLQRNFRSYGNPLSRDFKGLRIWMTLRYYGKQGISSLITRNILVAEYLRERIEEHPTMEYMAGNLSIVCFRWIGSDEMNEVLIEKIQRRKNFYLSRTRIKGKLTIRVCIVNLETTPAHMDALLNEIEEIAT
jgi:glutamate/tyrosine decarboxylase-like PLP-dependent enzyme